MNLKQIKTLAISGCGAGIEYYDFAIFAYFTPILAKAFFPEESTTLGVLYAFIILALGYFIRPIGGLIFGIIGDRYGRKTSFFFTMLTLAIATFIMAIMPTTQDIGIIAAIMFALLRIVQGIAIGGEIPTAITYSVEYFPKRKGFAVSIIFSCLGLGILLSTFIFMLVSNIPSSSMLYDYGWRIAFMFGAALSIIIYFLRKNLYETSDFIALIPQPMNLKAKKHFISSIAIGVLLVTPAAILTTQLFLFLPSYGSTYLGMSKNILSDHIFYGSCIMILGCLVGGLVSDYINKKTLFCFLLLLICLLSYIFYNQLIDGHLNAFLLMLIFAFFGMLASTYTVIIAEISQANFRCRSIGLSYNLSYSIFSAPIPALSILILDSTNLIMLPFWLIALSSIIGIIGTVATLSIWKNINQHQTLTCNQTI